ncbi:MAG TPA: dihydroorotate dehydrogenase [Methanomassiliicoccales archaeon]|jgi:dihydroorotate dehydrogenase (NAD+) catalytic subunit|nr:dihydroorotate dehydrogenase [Methanomassiliicoccales archaeon]
MTSLKVVLAGVEMENPTMLASGIMGETGGSLLAMAKGGAGALVTKSIGSVPRQGHKNPTLVELEYGYMNAMGLPNPGIEAFGDEMYEASKAGIPIVGSVFGSSAEEFASLARRMQEYGAEAVELNLSCPHAKGYGMEVGVDPEVVANIIKEVKQAVVIPVFAKLTPNTHKLIDVAKAAEDAGVDAIVAINTLKAMKIDVDARQPVLSNRYGGLSGPAVRGVGVRCVYELYEALKIPVIGVGGIEDWRSALEYMMAGAVAVQIGSGVGRNGPQVFGDICAGITSYMAQNNLRDITQLVGVAHD